MNTLSVNGKNWIFKKYNNSDVARYVEEFSLSEITAKLLSIRGIKDHSISSFLNPI